MKLAHHVTLELFVRPGETEAAIDALAPIPLSEIRFTQWHWHPTKENTKVYEIKKKKILFVESTVTGEEGEIIILQYRFSKQHDTDAFLQRLQALPREELAVIAEKVDDYLDGDGDLLLKLNRKAAELGMLKLGKGLLLRINLAAFPKNKETCKRVALTALSQ